MKPDNTIMKILFPGIYRKFDYDALANEMLKKSTFIKNVIIAVFVQFAIGVAIAVIYSINHPIFVVFILVVSIFNAIPINFLLIAMYKLYYAAIQQNHSSLNK